jgi:hypothetical protein
VREQPSHSGHAARVGRRQWGQTRVSTAALVPPMLSPNGRCGKTGDVGNTASMEPAELELQLVETRRQRFFVRSQLKVLRRHRERQSAAGNSVASSDARLAELERELYELDDAVEGMRARLGRPHRRRP